jgi:hypothetical protein
MGSDEDYDVFKAYSTPKKSGSPQKLKGLNTPSPSKKTPTESKKNNFGDPEVQEMMERMKNMHQVMEVKLSDSYEKLGWGPRSINTYLENPNNFSNEEWARIQAERSLVLKRLEEDLGLKESPKSIFAGEKKMLDPTEKERKSKTRGARRNWIPIR